MKIDVLTLFPQMFENVLGESMLKIAQRKKKVKINIYNLRDWTYNRHRTADDKPYGGGSGMVMKIEPIYRALDELLPKGVLKNVRDGRKTRMSLRIILLTPRGKKYNQKIAKRFSRFKRLILICGHYEGIDERVRMLVTDEISIGDYILTGGELPAMVIIDSVVRLIPGVLGDTCSAKHESFENNLLEYPQYTRPCVFEGMKVPEILLSGDHRAIEKWRREEAIKRTALFRKDLLNGG